MSKLILMAVLVGFPATTTADTLLQGHLACTSREAYDELTNAHQITIYEKKIATLKQHLAQDQEPKQHYDNEIEIVRLEGELAIAKIFTGEKIYSLRRGDSAVPSKMYFLPDGCFIVRRSAPASVIERPKLGVLKILADAGGDNMTLWVQNEAIER